jgi:hypothetical protein
MKQNARQYEFDGLCMTCNQARFCGYLARTEGPIWRCEEFDDSGPLEASTATVVASDTPTPAAESLVSESSEKPRGLCVNCDNLPTCGLPKDERGVLYCEEYL